MPFLLDTGILLRVVRPADPDHLLVRHALRLHRDRGESRYYTPQNLVEFWNVCSRPTTERGGFGLTVAETDRAARVIERLFTLMPDSPGLHVEWRRIVLAHSVHGVQVHDASLVAAMSTHGVTRILTLNPTDFSRYPGITAIHPGTL